MKRFALSIQSAEYGHVCFQPHFVIPACLGSCMHMYVYIYIYMCVCFCCITWYVIYAYQQHYYRQVIIFYQESICRCIYFLHIDLEGCVCVYLYIVAYSKKNIYIYI